MNESLIPSGSSSGGADEPYAMEHGIKGYQEHYSDAFDGAASASGSSTAPTGVGSSVLMDQSPITTASSSPPVPSGSPTVTPETPTGDDPDGVETKLRDRSNVIGLGIHTAKGMPGNLTDPVTHGRGALPDYKARGAANRARDVERGKAIVNKVVNPNRKTNAALREEAKKLLENPE